MAASDGIYPDRVQAIWYAVTGAAYYEVYRSTAPEDTGTLLGSTTGPSFNDTNASQGVLYYYRVKACNLTACSDFSAPDLGFLVLNPPQGVSASDGIYPDRIQVIWYAVTDAAYYEVYRSTAAEDTGTLLGSTTGPSFNDTNASQGVLYYYRVRACNLIGCSDFSAPDPGFLAAEA